MNNPYTVKGIFYSVLMYDDTPIKIYGMFGYSSAKKEANSLNIAFREGVYKTLTVLNISDKERNEILDMMHKRI